MSKIKEDLKKCLQIRTKTQKKLNVILQINKIILKDKI